VPGHRALPSTRRVARDGLGKRNRVPDTRKGLLIFCGIDWTEDHHGIAIVDEAGAQLAMRRIGDDAAGYATLLQLLAKHGETAEHLTPVAIETGPGLLVACLQASGRDVYVINPMAAARYREHTAVARPKSDAGDALVLANILRIDRHAHRPLPNDCDLARAITVLAPRPGLERARRDHNHHRRGPGPA
jgi:Transposase